MNQSELLPYVCGKIDGACIETDPFPHLIIPDFWPAWFYTLMAEDLPTGDAWKSRGTYGGGKTLMASYPDMSPYWHRVFDIFESDAFMACLSAKWRVEPGVSRCLLHKDLPGYGISPHTDALSKRIAYVCYCPQPTDSAWMHTRCHYLGTHLVTPLNPTVSAQWGDAHQPWYHFTVAKTIPYQDNTFVSWPRSDHSYHAVDNHILPSSPIEARYAVRGFVFDPDAPLPFIFQEDESERLYENRCYR